MAEYKNVENIRNLFDEEFKKTRRLIEQGENHLDNLAEGFLEADRVILKLPTADVVEVVRCKDCKHRTNKEICEKFRQRYPFFPEDDFYCGYGELKEREWK